MNRQNPLSTPWLCCVAATLTFAVFTPRAFAAILNVESYGAVPNNGSDATTAIQAAMNAATVSGDEVYIPAGTFNISNFLSPLSNTSVIGAGAGTTTLLYVGTAAHSMFNMTSVNNVEIANLTLDGDNGKSQVIDGIKATTCTGLNVNHVTIQNLGPAQSGDGIQLVSGVTGSTFENNTFTNIGVGAAWSSAFRISSGSSNNTISGNTINGTGRGGILCDTNSTNLIIENNTIKGSGEDGGTGLGIELYGGCNSAVVQNNSVDHWISISGSSYAGVRRNNVTPTDGTVGFTALECVTSQYSVFTDNVSTGGQGDGISISGGPEQYDFFAYNNFSNCTSWGIQVQYPNVSNLYFYKDTYASTLNSSGVPYSDGFGFRINGGGVQFVTLDGETMTGNPSYGIDILGTNQNPPVNWLAILNCTITNNLTAFNGGGTFTDLLWENNTVSGNGSNTVPTSVGYTDQQPLAIITAPPVVSVGQPVTFTSHSQAIDGSIVETLWDLNEGPGVSATSATYTYTTAGTYRISLLVWDTVGVGTHVQQTLAVGTGTNYYASNLTVGAQTAGITDRVVADGNEPNGELTYFDATAAGQSVSYVLPNVPAGTYDVLVGYKTYPNKGIWQLSASPAGNPGDSSNIGPAVDEYGANEIYPQVNLGNWTCGSTSNKWFTFTITGKNAASSGYDFNVDYIVLIPQ